MANTQGRLHVLGVLLLGGGVTAGLIAVERPADAQDVDGLTAALTLQRAFQSAIERAEPSVVSIGRFKLPSATGAERNFNRLRNPRRRIPFRPDSTDLDPDLIPIEFGTGIIIAPNDDKTQRLILTNYHVVRGGPPDKQLTDQSSMRLYVRFADRRGCNATILAADPRSDLAVLKPQLSTAGIEPADLKPIRLGMADNLKKGKLVLALGNPYAIARDGSASASWGIISNISRRPAPVVGPPDDPETLKKETVHHFGTLLQLDTRLNLGTSGGALIDLRGELIGITTSLAALAGYEKSVGFAIPIDKPTRRIIDALVKGHEVEYGFLGIKPNRISGARFKSLYPSAKQASAAEVHSVFPNAPAEAGGLRAGDVIMAINGKTIYDHHDLMREVGQQGPGAYARLRVWRRQFRKELQLTVKLGKWPVQDDEGIIATVPRYKPWEGLEVDYPTGRYKYFQHDRYPHAVVVTAIDSGSAASQTSELRVGDFISHVNGKPVRTPAEFHQTVRGLSGTVTLSRVNDVPVKLQISR